MQHHRYLSPGHVEGFCKHHNPFAAFLQLKYLHELKFISLFKFSPCRGNPLECGAKRFRAFVPRRAVTDIPISVAHCLIGSTYSLRTLKESVRRAARSAIVGDASHFGDDCRIMHRRTDKFFNQCLRGFLNKAPSSANILP